MTNNLKVGDRVHAIDELGRWTPAVVLDITSSDTTDSGSCTIRVKFSGWGDEFNRLVAQEAVRLPLPPLEEQERRNCVIEEKRHRGKQRKLSIASSSTLCRGDTVYVNDDVHTVNIVDPFSCCVVLEDGCTVSFTDVHDKRTSSSSTCTSKKRRKTKSSGGCKNVPGGTEENQLVVRNPAVTAIEEVTLDVSVPQEGVGVYTTHDVTCGTIYKVADSGVSIAVAHINIFRKIATGWLVYDGVMDKSCVLQLPVAKLHECPQPKLGIVDRKWLINCRDRRFSETMTNMEQNNYRKEMRKDQLVNILKREVGVALKRRHKSHAFSLGLYVPDVDSELLKLHPGSRTMRYSYELGNLKHLDAVLGSHWDVVFSDNITVFLTSVCFKLTKDYCVSVGIQGGQFLGRIVPTSYRCTLAAHIADLSLQLQPPPLDTTGDEADSMMEVFHYGILRHMTDAEKKHLHHPLLDRLRHVSDLRQYMEPDCEMREDVWNWLVDNLPKAFHPKGRGDADCIEAFNVINNEGTGNMFKTSYSGTLYCPVCNKTTPMAASAGPVYDYTQSVNEQWPGQFNKAIEVALHQGLQEEYFRQCTTCLIDLFVEKHSEMLTMANFLLVYIGLLNGQNLQEPAVIVPEETTVNGIDYILTGAVCVRPGHFFCIVKDGESFLVLDDLKEEAVAYPTFGAAVNKDPQLSSKSIALSPGNGVNLVIFTRQTQIMQMDNLSPTDKGNDTPINDNDAEMTNQPSLCSGYHNNNRLHGAPPDLTSSGQNDRHGIISLETSDSQMVTPLKPETMTSIFDQAESFTYKKNTEERTGPPSSPIVCQHHDDSLFQPVVDASCSFNPICHSSPVALLLQSGIRNAENKQSSHNTKKKDTCSNGNIQSETCIGKELHKDVDWKLTNICAHDVKVVHLYESDYFDCKSVFVAANIYSQIEKIGFKKIDNMLRQTKSISLPDAFLCKGHSRIWIRKDALISVLTNEASSHNTAADWVKQAILKVRYKRIRSRSANAVTDQSMKSDFSKLKTSTSIDIDAVSTGKLHVAGSSVTYHVEANELYVNTTEIFSVMGLSKHKAKRGFVNIDNYIKAGGMDPTKCFIMNGRERHYIKVDALNILVANLPSSLMSYACQVEFNHTFSKALQTHAVEQCNRRRVPDKANKPEAVGAIQNLISEHFNDDKQTFLNTLSATILTPDDIKYLVERAHGKTKKGAKKVKQCIKEVYRGMFPMLPEDLVNIQENFSGVHRTNEMRKILPGVIPSRIVEMELKSRMSREFMAVMLPKRISTGWTVDASRLLEVLQFKYSFLEGTIFAKLQGDGRLVGGRHSAYIGLNLLNHELKLRGISYQNPKDICPISVFYESDSRDNLEKNIGEQNSLNNMITAAPPNVKFFLGGDEMFLEAILDGSNILGPTTNTGWNIYDECDKEQKKAVAASGLRTDIRMPINREHPESLLPSIPIERTVFCILHGLARIVEKLVMLEVEGIISTTNKVAQTRSGITTEDLVHNLESNINARGVRQGNFHVPFDKSGKPEKISLNKDHALVIISPSPVGKEQQFPHVLTNVVPDTIMANTLPLTVRQYLKIEHDFTELKCVMMIWESVYEMFKILQKEPAQTLQESAIEGSTRPSDYSFSYSDEQMNTYKFHAERLYQLFCLRYTFKNLTPYILKFVDYGLHFMANLGIPLCRFSTEGGEHSNYIHNCFHYQHTTRNGGRDSNHDPNFAILLSSWRNLYYDISKGDADAAAAFQTYVQKHVWASLLQRKVRKWLFKATCRKIGLVNPTSALDRERKTEKLAELESIVSQRMEVSQVKGLLEGSSYILCGNAPKYNGQKMTHQCLTKLITEHGGKVKKNMPGSSKGRSTKQYILLVNIKPGAITPRIVADAIRRRYTVVDYKFLYETVDKKTFQDFNQYVPPVVGNISRRINVMPSLYHKHFQKRAKMVTLLKERQKRRTKTEKRVKAPRNLAIFYAIVKRREFLKKKNVSFANSAKLFGQFSKDSKKLTQFERTQYFEMWQQLKQQQKDQAKKAANLVAYNTTYNSNYSNVVTSMNSTTSEI